MAGNLYSYIVMDFMIMMDRNDEKARLDLISVSEVGTATKVGREFSGDPREHRNEINLYLISRNVGRRLGFCWKQFISNCEIKAGQNSGSFSRLPENKRQISW